MPPTRQTSATSPSTPALGALPPRDAVLRWARDLYEHAVDRKDAAGFAAAFTEDASLRFGNAPSSVGRGAIETAIAGFFTAFVSLRPQGRPPLLVDDTLVLEAEVTYTRHDAAVVTVPAVTIFHLAGSAPGEPDRPIADDCRIYVDLTPLFAPGA